MVKVGKSSDWNPIGNHIGKEGNIAAWEETLWGCTPWGFCPVKNISKSCGVQHVGLTAKGLRWAYISSIKHLTLKEIN